ncbi:phage tail protein [Neobacillus niacini]|uniref:phage tail protein n=1 Tax=Neobacillus niacini TaxID=86668 RepID=UPI002FFF39B9
MLIITDIAGNTEALTGYKGLKRYRNVSGEKTLAFLLLPTEQNQHSFHMVQEESIVEFKGEEYRIKQISEKPRGQTYTKEVVAIHTLFDLIDEHIYEVRNGSMTFQAFLQFVFVGTPYTWDIVDTFYAADWENLGDDNRLSLFQDGLKRYKAEFTLSGTHFTFKQKIGNATDFQFRYSYNIKTLNKSVNTNNLSTYIKGYGKQNEDGSYVVQSEYTSPNYAIFGIRHAKPVRDERYTTSEGLNERLVTELKDTPDLSITLDFVDLRRAGFPYDVPGEGDDVFLIYEPMNLDLETRIMDITEEFTESSEYPIKTDVTLANFRNNMTDKFVEFSRTQKQVNGILDGSRKIPYNALDDAVKRATAALQAAQTELEFENGIIARDKNNPNFLVLFNSNGIGISRDGGQTFKEALTSDGFVASAGVIGQFAANNIQIGPDTTYEPGYDPTKIKVGGRNFITESSANNVYPKLAGTYATSRATPFLYSDYAGIECIDYTDAYYQLGALNADMKGFSAGDVITFSGYFANDISNALVTFFYHIPNTWREASYEINTSPWGKFSCSFTIPEGTTGFMMRIVFPRNSSSNGKSIRFKNLQLEKGTLATDWAPAPEDAPAQIKNDLRMTAPLPTSLTMNQDGIRASTGTSDKYAQMDYRGLFINKGAVQIQRADGYNVMVDGILKNGFNLFSAYPPFRTEGAVQVGPWMKVATTNRFETINSYTFRHDSRYILVQFGLYTDNAIMGYMSFDLSDVDGGGALINLGTSTNNGPDEDGVYGYLLDLGVPTGQLKRLNIRLYGSDPNWGVYGRILYLSQEG